MALIKIKDLQQSDDLDREAMRSIVGGSLTGARPMQANPTLANSGRVVDFPRGFGGRGLMPARSLRIAE
jgi:hypothetical protein